jgi:hypothetical protein
MTIEELKLKMSKASTAFQFEAAIKEFIGHEIEIENSIKEISNNVIELHNPYHHIEFDRIKFGEELLTYSRGTRVVIVGKLIKAHKWNDNESYDFDLVSIRMQK